jgi:hypothetical protein
MLVGFYVTCLVGDVMIDSDNKNGIKFNYTGSIL